jgi:membrane protease YdiL (CAAX protease family)
MEDKMEIKTYPGIKSAILLSLLLLAIQTVGGAILGIFIGLFGISNESLFYGISVILLNVVSFAVVILVGFKKTKENFNEVFNINNIAFDYWLAIIIFMFGFIILSSEIDNILNFILPMPEFLQDTFQTLMVNQEFIVSLILIGIVPAITEEMFFRGVVLNGFKENYSEKKAIVISALLFGIIHLNPWQFVTAFIFGLIAAWICIKTKSILLCVYMHLFNNVINVIALRYKEVLPIRGFNTALSETTFQPIWFDCIGIIVTALGILLILRAVKKANTISN